MDPPRAPRADPARAGAAGLCVQPPTSRTAPARIASRSRLRRREELLDLSRQTGFQFARNLVKDIRREYANWAALQATICSADSAGNASAPPGLPGAGGGGPDRASPRESPALRPGRVVSLLSGGRFGRGRNSAMKRTPSEPPRMISPTTRSRGKESPWCLMHPPISKLLGKSLQTQRRFPPQAPRQCKFDPRPRHIVQETLSDSAPRPIRGVPSQQQRSLTKCGDRRTLPREVAIFGQWQRGSPQQRRRSYFVNASISASVCKRAPVGKRTVGVSRTM